jgi:3-oxoacyl-[acyl-carrier-protein] synthase II
MKRPVISGLGLLSPFGAGMEPLWQSLASGSSGIRSLSRFSSVSGALGSEITDIDLDDIIDNRKFRRAADVSKYALAAIQLAINDASLDSAAGEDSAMVTAVTHGAMNYTQAYHKSLVTGGVEDISPILFSDSVLNAPAGNASICYGIQGAVHTIVGGTAASIKAAMIACRLIREDGINRSVVVSAEEMNELSFYCRKKLGESEMSEGAGVFLIEDASVRKGRQPYCCISGYASYIDPDGPDVSFQMAVDKALSMAGIAKHDLDFALTDMPPGMCMRHLDGIPSDTVSRYTGNAFCVSSSWNIMLAAYIIYKDALPDSFIKRCEEERKLNTIRNVIVCNLEETGAAAAIVLSKQEHV